MDGKSLSWSVDGILCLWDANSGEVLAKLEGHSDLITGAIQLRDGRLLSADACGDLRLWDSDSGKCLAILEGHTEVVGGVFQLQDGRFLSWSGSRPPPITGNVSFWHNFDDIGGSGDGTLRIWSSDSGKCLTILEGHSDKIEGATQLKNGRILSWSSDCTLRLWDANSGDCLSIFEGHSGGVSGAIQLMDAKVLSWGDTLRLWDADTGQCLATLEGHTTEIQGAQQLEDGRILSWGSGAWSGTENRWANDGTLRLWDADTGQQLGTWFIEQAASETPELWQAYIEASFPHKIDAGSFKNGIRCCFMDTETNVIWQCEGKWDSFLLLPEGKIVANCDRHLESLSLHYGNRRVTLAEAKELLK
jgi:WD40 repeat protein